MSSDSLPTWERRDTIDGPRQKLKHNPPKNCVQALPSSKSDGLHVIFFCLRLDPAKRKVFHKRATAEICGQHAPQSFTNVPPLTLGHVAYPSGSFGFVCCQSARCGNCHRCWNRAPSPGRLPGAWHPHQARCQVPALVTQQASTARCTLISPRWSWLRKMLKHSRRYSAQVPGRTWETSRFVAFCDTVWQPQKTMPKRFVARFGWQYGSASECSRRCGTLSQLRVGDTSQSSLRIQPPRKPAPTRYVCRTSDFGLPTSPPISEGCLCAKDHQKANRERQLTGSPRVVQKRQRR